MAEGEGFEPPVRFPVQRFSRPPVSTTHTSLRVREYSLKFTSSWLNHALRKNCRPLHSPRK